MGVATGAETFWGALGGVKETVLVPFAQDYVPKVDLERKELVLDLPETYLDEAEEG